jgi:3-oxoacyl-[acyl-carrier protein] reductase
VAIVTGASKGIGAAVAKGLAAAGASVTVNYSSDKEGADRTVAEVAAKGGRAIAIQADVSKAADVKRQFEETRKAFGSIDLLVNNAGVFEFGPPRGRDREWIPSRIRHRRPRANPGDAGCAEAFPAEWR